MSFLLRVLLLSVTSAAVYLIPLHAAQASLLVASYKDGLQATEAQFQSSSYDVIQNHVYQRQDYSSVAVEVIMQIGPKNLPEHGERWGVRSYEVTTNTFIAEIFWVYDAISDCVYDYYGRGYCGIKYNPDYIQRFLAYFEVQCNPRVSSTTGQDLEYKTVGFHDTTDLGTYNYKPTEYVPMVYATSYDQGRNVRPTLPGAAADRIDVKVLVSDNLGCLKAVRDVKTTLTNTIAPTSGGHTHFTSAHEPGTGAYTSQTAWGGTVKTLAADHKVAIENGLTDKNGLFQAGYEAGDLSLLETVTIETKNREDISGEPALRYLRIRLPGLVGLPQQGTGYYVDVLSAPAHAPRINYALPGVRNRLAEIPNIFAARVKLRAGPNAAVPVLKYTSMSLPDGGLFDIGPQPDHPEYKFRQAPHGSHRTGIDVDLGLVSAGRQRLLAAIIREQCFVMNVPRERPSDAIDHWHLRYSTGNCQL